MNKKVICLILDGWGYGKPDKFNAIDNAKKPNFKHLVEKYPNITLKVDGLAVGLPEGQFGTSEINHQIMGSGRIFFQDLPKINKAIEDGTFFTNESLVNACEYTVKNSSRLHIFGILSDGGIHTDINHLIALLKLAKEQNVKETFLHIFTDGRDCPPRSAEKYFKILDSLKKDYDFKIATIQGRFFLDRDRDWAKTETAVNLMVEGKGNKMETWEDVLNFTYNQNIDDEFIKQYILEEDGIIKENDSVVFYHYRTDRAYQITKEILKRNIKNMLFTTFIENSEEFTTCNVAFPRDKINQTLAQTLSENGKIQYHLSETEKFTHLTSFFNGGKEKPFENEEWELIESDRFVKPHYNFEPSMQCFNLTKKILNKIEENKTDFILINFPNADMVGHSGNYNAAVISVEALDYCLGKIYEIIKDKLDEYAMIITADHGNADQMWDYENDQPHTQHTLNPVPFVLVTDLDCHLDKKESLQDVAPTILYLMGISKPNIMTGENLIIRN